VLPNKIQLYSTSQLTALPGVEVLNTFGLNTDWCSVSIKAVSNGLQQRTRFYSQQSPLYLYSTQHTQHEAIILHQQQGTILTPKHACKTVHTKR